MVKKDNFFFIIIIIQLYSLLVIQLFSNEEIKRPLQNGIIQVKNKIIIEEIYDINISEGHFKIATEFLQTWNNNNLKSDKLKVYTGQAFDDFLHTMWSPKFIITNEEESRNTSVQMLVVDKKGELKCDCEPSCLKRTKQTAKHFTQKKIESRLLNEIHGGICENLSYDEIEEKYPNITTDRKKDKLRFRYPQGESYLDLLERLRYFVLQLTSYNKPILIVAHNAIIKVLLGYFEEEKHEDIPHSDIDLNTVIKLTPNSKNYDIEYKNLVNDIKN